MNITILIHPVIYRVNLLAFDFYSFFRDVFRRLFGQPSEQDACLKVCVLKPCLIYQMNMIKKLLDVQYRL